MTLFRLLLRQSNISIRTLVVVTGIAGLSNVAVLAVINAAAANAAEQVHSFRHLTMFLLALVIYVLTQRYVMRTTAAEVETTLHDMRMQMMDRIRHADLLPLESVGRARIDAGVAKETIVISQATQPIAMGLQSAIVVVFILIYLAWLSLPAFVLAVGFLSIAMAVHFNRLKLILAEVHEVLERENQMFDSVTDVLEGFKENKMNTARSDDVYAFLNSISESATQLKIKTKTRQADHYIWSQAIFFLLVGAIVFLLPRFSIPHSEVILKSTTTMMFLFGPLSMMVGSIPILANANAAAENIYELESQLDQFIRTPGSTDHSIRGFEEIHLEAVSFDYEPKDGDAPFGIGPIDLGIRAGEILFVAGGNGSGKSTLLKLILGLYFPDKGIIRVDGVPVTDKRYEGYRGLFSVVFSDYHLFRRLYGLGDVDSEHVDSLLRELELVDKVSVVDGEFSTLELSTGQRKRLALFVSLLEDRPILVFDEWAADQDPTFRRKFYEEMLPALKSRGKTIIAATHDDRYFSVADKLLAMEEGRVHEMPLSPEI
jgi:putative ATP-binding cassette transporter